LLYWAYSFLLVGAMVWTTMLDRMHRASGGAPRGGLNCS
jgi:hypothetical protein